MNALKPVVGYMTVGATVLLAALTMPAQAKSAHAGVSAHISVPHHGGRHHHHAHRFHHPRAHRHHEHGGHHHGHLYFRSARGCYPVKKYVYDHHGHATKVIRTICYDLHGNGYIVFGSRHAYGH